MRFQVFRTERGAVALGTELIIERSGKGHCEEGSLLLVFCQILFSPTVPEIRLPDRIRSLPLFTHLFLLQGDVRRNQLRCNRPSLLMVKAGNGG